MVASETPSHELAPSLRIAAGRAGVAMAEAILARSSRADVVRLATGIVNGQQAEIALMTDMLAKRGVTS